MEPFYSIQREGAEPYLSDVGLVLPHFPYKLVLHISFKTLVCTHACGYVHMLKATYTTLRVPITIFLLPKTSFN